MKSSMREVLTLGIVLGIVSMIAALGLSVTYSITKPKIEEQALIALKNAQKEIFPEAGEFIKSEDLVGLKNGSTVIKEFFIVKDANQNTIGYLVTATTPGYGGNIAFIVGISQDNTLKSIKVTEHTETPGLGANITKGSFLDQFNQKKIDDAFLVKQDVKAITAATISSKALTNGIKAIIELYKTTVGGLTNE